MIRFEKGISVGLILLLLFLLQHETLSSFHMLPHPLTMTTMLIVFITRSPITLHLRLDGSILTPKLEVFTRIVSDRQDSSLSHRFVMRAEGGDTNDFSQPEINDVTTCTFHASALSVYSMTQSGCDLMVERGTRRFSQVAAVAFFGQCTVTAFLTGPYWSR